MENKYLFILSIFLLATIVVLSVKYITWFRHFTKGGK